MKKLKLNLDELKVETFEMDDNFLKNGTLYGMGASEDRCTGMACNTGVVGIAACEGNDDDGPGTGGTKNYCPSNYIVECLAATKLAFTVCVAIGEYTIIASCLGNTCYVHDSCGCGYKSVTCETDWFSNQKWIC